jgi:hypothetical protein
MGEFKLKQGWFLSPHNGVRPRLPFQDMMSGLYESRSLSPTASFFLKRVMNGFIGKMLETRKDSDGNITEYGKYYNSIYHSLCTTRTRLQVFDFLVQNEITQPELVFIGVDGVKATKYIPVPGSAPMGKWRFAGSEPTFILSPGAVITPNRNYKSVGHDELLSQIQGKLSSSKFGKSGDIDLRKLFLNQNRNFPRLPRTGQSLLSSRFQSSPVVL